MRVDRAARFPAEAFAALKEQKLLGILVPRAFGGEGASVRDVAEICHILGQVLRCDRDDLRDASDPGGVRRHPRAGIELAPAA